MKRAGIYIHIPFCRRACFYCHFFKIPYTAEQASWYGHWLEKEIALKKKSDCQIDTIYLGGGSPSLLGGRLLEKIMEVIRTSFQLHPGLELTLEVNPEDVTPAKVKTWKGLGFNRLSLGVQSFNPIDLIKLKRNHDVGQAIRAIDRIQSVGIENLSIDLIIGMEHQTCRDLEYSLSQAVGRRVPHVSVYILEGVAGHDFPDREQKECELYFFAREFLMARGFVHYEVSNFGQKGFFSRHNLKYWHNRPYLGLGAGASGYENSLDYQNVTDLKQYEALLKENRLPIKKATRTSKPVRRVVVGLRLLEGIAASAFVSFPETVQFLLAEQLLVQRDNKIAVHPEKILLLNEILTYFV